MIRFIFFTIRKHMLGLVCLWTFKSRFSISVIFPSTSSSLSLSHSCLLLHTRHTSHSPHCLSSVTPYLSEEEMNKYPCISLHSGGKGKAIEILMGASVRCDGEKWGERIEANAARRCVSDTKVCSWMDKWLDDVPLWSRVEYFLKCWIQFCPTIHGPQIMSPNDLDDQTTFNPAPSICQNVSKILMLAC